MLAAAPRVDVGAADGPARPGAGSTERYGPRPTPGSVSVRSTSGWVAAAIPRARSAGAAPGYRQAPVERPVPVALR